MTDDRVIELVRRLKALAEDAGAFPAERERAAMHMQRLIARHQLSAFDVERKVYAEDVVAVEVVTDQSAPKGHWWALVSAMARAHDCRIVYRRAGAGLGGITRVVVTWIGHQSDVAVGAYLFDYCWQYLRKASEAEGRTKGKAGYDLRSYCCEYITAAAYALERRLRAEREEASEEPDPVEGVANNFRALVVVKEDKVADYVKRTYPSLKGRQSSKHYVGDGSGDGARAGSTMPIRRGVGNKGGSARIGGGDGQA